MATKKVKTPPAPGMNIHMGNIWKISRMNVMFIVVTFACLLMSSIMSRDPALWHAALGTFLLAAVLAVVSVVQGIATTARLVEYDRLINELIRINATSILNPGVDKLLSKFCHTDGRRHVLALALSTLKNSPSDMISTVKEMYNCKSAKRLNKVRLLSKEWVDAVFFPAWLL